MSHLFFAYVSDDESLKRELTDYLQKMGVTTEDAPLRLGDSLSYTLEEGLRRSDYGVVILSPAFLRRPWPRQDIDKMATMDRSFSGKSLILPVYHGVTQQDVARHSPTLASRMGVSIEDGPEQAAQAIAEVVQHETGYEPQQFSQQAMMKGMVQQRSAPLTDDLPRLRDILVESFSMSELRDICFDLSIDFDDLPGESKRVKVIELIGFLQRRGRLDDLVRLVLTHRPHLTLS
jgi:hypothetical protein